MTAGVELAGALPVAVVTDDDLPTVAGSRVNIGPLLIQGDRRRVSNMSTTDPVYYAEGEQTPAPARGEGAAPAPVGPSHQIAPLACVDLPWDYGAVWWFWTGYGRVARLAVSRAP